MRAFSRHARTGSIPTGKRGIKFCYVVRQHDAEVVLVFETPKGRPVNTRAFEALLDHRSEIDAAFGGPLHWPTQPGTVRRRVGHVIPLGGYRDRERWPMIQEEMIRSMQALQGAFRHTSGAFTSYPTPDDRGRFAGAALARAATGA